MLKLIAVYGIQGSGKTTLAKFLENRYQVKRYSFDEIHIENRQDLKTFYQNLIQELNNGNNIVLDGIFYTQKREREELLSLFSNIDVEKIIFIMSTPYEECLIRNSKRESPVSENMIEITQLMSEPPAYEEGWDKIILY